MIRQICRTAPRSFKCVASGIVVFLLSALFFNGDTHAQRASQKAEREYSRALKFHNAGQPSKALPHIRAARNLVARHPGRRTRAYAITLKMEASILAALKKSDLALKVADQALRTFIRSVGAHHVDVADMLYKMGNIHVGAGQLEDAYATWLRALDVYEKAVGPDHPKLLSTLQNASEYNRRQTLLDDAVRFAERAASIAISSLKKDHPYFTTPIRQLGLVYSDMGRFEDAEKRYREIWKIEQGRPTRNAANFLQAMSDLSNVLTETQKLDEAEDLAEQALLFARKTFGPNHPRVAKILDERGVLLSKRGRYRDALAASRESLRLRNATLGSDHREVGIGHTNIAFILIELGRYTDAERNLKAALEILDRKTTMRTEVRGALLLNLATLYERTGRLTEAEALFRQSVSVYTEVFSDDHHRIARARFNLARLLGNTGRYDESDALTRKALKSTRRAYGDDSTNAANMMGNLAGNHLARGEPRKATKIYEKILAIFEKRLGPTHPDVSYWLSLLGERAFESGELPLSADYLNRSIALLGSLGPRHERLAAPLITQARLNGATGKTAQSLAAFRKAIAILIHNFDPLTSADSDTKRLLGGDDITPNAIEFFVAALDQFQNEGAVATREAAAESFQVAQWLGLTSVGSALQQTAVRVLVSGSDLERLSRKVQDLKRQKTALDKALLEALGRPSNALHSQTVARLRKQIRAMSERLAPLEAKLRADFPRYAELTRPMPLSLNDTQALLTEQDALLFYMTSRKHTYVWAVTSDAVTWARINRSQAEIERDVTKLRKSLDPTAAITAQGRGFSREVVCRGLERQAKGCEAYDTDLARAHGLYRTLLTPVEQTLTGKRHLMIVPSGPLTGLPFHMLLTSAPPTGGTLDEQFKQASWLIRHHAVTVLPAVAALRALRVFGKNAEAERAFIGFGDPEFSKPDSAARKAKEDGKKKRIRGYATFFRGALADVDMLSRAIPPLPDTADELKAVGSLLKAHQSEIILGRQASETTIKALSAAGRLKDYRVVHFATHGLIAGEIRGLAEPALALSIPSRATENDDGLLTASEVAQLKLDADWVVLSACNTAAGEKPGAEAFSGLARAFFYSGSRALLVSHWPVISEAAVKLTTGAFSAMETDRTIGRAEALRRSMLALIDNGEPHERHPAYWAPFVVVGEGAKITTN